MRQFFSYLLIYSLLHLSVPAAYARSVEDRGNSQTTYSDKRINFMKTIHELPDMAVGGLITPEGLDDIISRGREVMDEAGSSAEKNQFLNNIIKPLENVRDGGSKLEDCIAKRDPNAVDRVEKAYYTGAFSNMVSHDFCSECNEGSADWTGLSAWSSQMGKIGEELQKNRREYFDEKTEDLKKKLFEAERERILVPYLAIKASYEPGPLEATPEEVLKKIGMATTVADTLPVMALPLMPMPGQESPYDQSIIDNNLRRTVENMIQYSREMKESEKAKEKEYFFDLTNKLIDDYNEAYRTLHGRDSDRDREQIQEARQEKERLGREVINLEQQVQKERNPGRRDQLIREMTQAQRGIESRQSTIEWREKNLAQREWNVKELEHRMTMNPVINGSALDREDRGRKAPTVREQLFHEVENTTREALTHEQMEKYLQLYYDASENLLKSLDEWNRDPDPSLLIENTLYSNPTVAGEILSEDPEMAGRLCYFIEKGVEDKSRQRKWDKIMDWAKIVALMALLVATGVGAVAGGVAIAMAMGLGAAFGTVNGIRGVQLRREYQNAKEHLIALGVGNVEEVDEVLRLSKRRFINAAMDYGLAASSGLAMINGIGTMTGGGTAAISSATSTYAGIQSLIKTGTKVGSVLAIGGLVGCKNVLMDVPVIDTDGDDIPDDTDDDNPDSTGYDYSLSCFEGHQDYTGPVNEDGCPSKYPIDKECYNLISDVVSDLKFSWEFDGNRELVNMFKLHWGRSSGDYPDSEISINNETEMSFDPSHFGGTGDFYVTVSSVGFDMAESGKAVPILVKICQ